MNQFPTHLPSVARYSRDVVQRFGDPFIVFKAKTTLNVSTIGRLFSRSNEVFWDPQGASLYKPTGTSKILQPLSNETATDLLREFIARMAKREKIPTGSFKMTESVIRAILGVVRSESLYPSFAHQNLFPVKNGIVHFGKKTPRLFKHKLEYGFKHESPVCYDPKAKCPEFLKFLEELLPDAAARRQAKLYLGGAFTGSNLTRRILLMRGVGGCGKSTLLKLQEAMLGHNFVRDLRLDFLTARFEPSFFLGARQLSAKDVPGDSLQRRSAKALKFLSGGDITQAEQKFRGKVSVQGSYFIVIVSNGELRVTTENDEKAWMDRLLVLDCKPPAVRKKIANYADVLLAKEGEGILNFFIEGGQEYLREISKYGDIRTTVEQEQQVGKLVMASKNFDLFFRSHIATAKSSVLSNDMILRKYAEYCRLNEVPPVSSHVIFARLPDLMLHVHGATRNASLKEGKITSRAYNNVKFVGI